MSAHATGIDAPARRHGLAYDAGLGFGGAGLGIIAARTGYLYGFALTALVVLAPLLALTKGPPRHLRQPHSPINDQRAEARGSRSI